MNVHAITAWRIFSTGVKNLFRNAWLSIAAIAVMVVALTIIMNAIVLDTTARNAISELSTDLKISIFLEDATTTDQRTDLQQRLQREQFVESVDYVDVEQARTDFLASISDDPELLESFALAGQDILPASLAVGLNDLSFAEDVTSIAEEEQYAAFVQEVRLGATDNDSTIEKAASAQRFITTASVASAVVFTVVSVLIIFNTIRMAIFTRSEEIRIMKLIGATPGFIRGPFLVEASMYGVIAGLIAGGINYSLVYALGSNVASQREFVDSYEFFTRPETVIGMVALGIVGGILVGLFSSALAMERHLKAKHW